MSFLDKAKGLMNEHPDQAESISDTLLGKGGDLADKATGGKYSDRIDDAQGKADDAIGEPTSTTGQDQPRPDTPSHPVP